MKLKYLQEMGVDRNMDVAKKYYVMYCRKSSETEDRQVESIPDQFKILTGLAKERGLKVKHVFQESMSAKKPGRPEFNEMVQHIDENSSAIKVGVLCWKVNRLFRNPEDEGVIRQRLYDRRLEDIITPGKTYYEADSDFILAVEGAQAQRFIKDLREDTQRGIDSKLEKGFAPILAPPGYINNIQKSQGKKDISAHPTYFILMRKIFELALTGNFSIQNLVVKADELGIENSRGKEISKSQMCRILRNPFYTGRFVYAGKLYNNGKHPPMLTDDEFDLLQDILSGRSRPRKQKHDFWHTGIPIVCGECGGHITGEYKTKHYKNGNSQIFLYARCTKKNKSHKCLQPYISTTELEKQVIEVLGTLKLSKKFVDWAIKWLNVVNQGQNETREARYNSLKRSYEDIVGKIKNLLDLKISPDNKNGSLISNEEFAEKKTSLMNEKAKVQEYLAKVDRHIDEWTELAAKTFDFAATAQEKFANGDIENRKIILRAIGSNLVLKDKQLTIKPRSPFLMIQKALGEIKDFERLVPKEKADIMLQTGDLQLQNVVWGG